MSWHNTSNGLRQIESARNLDKAQLLRRNRDEAGKEIAKSMQSFYQADGDYFEELKI